MSKPIEFKPEWIEMLAATPTSDDISAQLAALDAIQRWALSMPADEDSDGGEL